MAMAMAMSELETLQQRLAEAEAQLHQIQMKGSITQTAFSLGGQNAVQRSAVDPVKLEAYVNRLRMQIARLEGRNVRTGQVIW